MFPENWEISFGSTKTEKWNSAWSKVSVLCNKTDPVSRNLQLIQCYIEYWPCKILNRSYWITISAFIKTFNIQFTYIVFERKLVSDGTKNVWTFAENLVGVKLTRNPNGDTFVHQFV